MKSITVGLLCVLSLTALAGSSDGQTKKWKAGSGWGWVWGAENEVGSLNEITSASVLKALSLVKQGEIRDLGITYDRRSYDKQEKRHDGRIYDAASCCLLTNGK